MTDNMHYILIGVFLAIFLIGIFYFRNRNVQTRLQFSLITYGAVMVVLLFMLPQTPSLSTFGYPDSVVDLDSSKKLLKYLQRYNDAIVKTTEVVYYMIFITVFWLLPTLLSVIKRMKFVDVEDQSHS